MNAAESPLLDPPSTGPACGASGTGGFLQRCSLAARYPAGDSAAAAPSLTSCSSTCPLSGSHRGDESGLSPGGRLDARWLPGRGAEASPTPCPCQRASPKAASRGAACCVTRRGRRSGEAAHPPRRRPLLVLQCGNGVSGLLARQSSDSASTPLDWHSREVLKCQSRVSGEC